MSSIWRPWGSGSSPPVISTGLSPGPAIPITPNLQWLKYLNGIRECSVVMEKTTPEEIRRYNRGVMENHPIHPPPIIPLPAPPVQTVEPRASPAPWMTPTPRRGGKQLHLLKMLLHRRGRGRPRKTMQKNGQCMITSLSGTKLTIAKVKKDDQHPEGHERFRLPENLEERKRKCDEIEEEVAAVASAIVDDGCFDSALKEKDPNVRPRKKRLRGNLTPSHSWTTTNSHIFSYSSSFTSRSSFIGGGRGGGGVTPKRRVRSRPKKKPKLEKKPKVPVPSNPSPPREKIRITPAQIPPYIPTEGSSSESVFYPVTYKKKANDGGSSRKVMQRVIAPGYEAVNRALEEFYKSRARHPVLVPPPPPVPEYVLPRDRTSDEMEKPKNISPIKVSTPKVSIGKPSIFSLKASTVSITPTSSGASLESAERQGTVEHLRDANLEVEDGQGQNIEVEDNINWISEFVESNLETEVVKEALKDCYMPDISVIHGLTSNVENISRSSSVTYDMISSSSDLELDDLDNMVTPEAIIDEEPTLSEEVRSQNISTPTQRAHSALDDDNNDHDILTLFAEDDDLPLPF